MVLIKRYWMEQEVGWAEWSSAVLSCIPVLGKIGGLALRGVAGAAKWFLRSRHLRHLAQGSRYLDDARRLYRRFAGWISNCEPEDNHHLWPIYLGGDAVDLQLECHEETIGFFMVSLIVNSLT